ncbi:hypothetical protein DRH14_04205 [Candidatus Shapirobacteria bacterium]|nr:MAG: hypothetical protein DRH14_04205 [Candidatus Shapirobacteria bacterium]
MLKLVRRTPQWATKIFKYRKTIAILSVAVTVMAVMLLIPPSENAPQPASAPPVDLTGFVIVYMFGVLLFIVYIIKSKHLDYKSPILQLREDKNYARKLIEELKDFPCPYCGGPVEVDKLFLVGKDLVRLKCRSCDRISLFEYLNKRWVLIGPVTPYVEKPIEYYKRALEALEVSV